MKGQQQIDLAGLIPDLPDKPHPAQLTRAHAYRDRLPRKGIFLKQKLYKTDNSGIYNRGSANSAGRSSKHSYKLNLRVPIEACWHYRRDPEDRRKRRRLLGQIGGGEV
jgi:hypothetical protein